MDNVRLATGEGVKETRSIVTFSTVKMVTVVINGGLVVNTSYHKGEDERSRLEVMCIFEGFGYVGGSRL